MYADRRTDLYCCTLQTSMHASAMYSNTIKRECHLKITDTIYRYNAEFKLMDVEVLVVISRKFKKEVVTKAGTDVSCAA